MPGALRPELRSPTQAERAPWRAAPAILALVAGTALALAPQEARVDPRAPRQLARLRELVAEIRRARPEHFDAVDWPSSREWRLQHTRAEQIEAELGRLVMLLEQHIVTLERGGGTLPDAEREERQLVAGARAEYELTAAGPVEDAWLRVENLGAAPIVGPRIERLGLASGAGPSLPWPDFSLAPGEQITYRWMGNGLRFAVDPREPAALAATGEFVSRWTCDGPHRGRRVRLPHPILDGHVELGVEGAEAQGWVVRLRAGDRAWVELPWVQRASAADTAGTSRAVLTGLLANGCAAPDLAVEIEVVAPASAEESSPAAELVLQFEHDPAFLPRLGEGPRRFAWTCSSADARAKVSHGFNSP